MSQMGRYLKTFFDKCSRRIFYGDVVSECSMTPTILDGDILFTDRLSVYFNRIKKGDVIIAEDLGESRLFCNRIVGMPGDKIQVGLRTVIVPPRHVWLEGDNKKPYEDEDTRTLSAVPQFLILSKVRALLRTDSLLLI